MRFSAVIFIAVVSCKVQESEPAPVKLGDLRATAMATASAHVAAQKLGAPIDSSAKTIALAEAATHKGEKVVTEGRVTRVCQERGCWLALRSDKSDAVVRMHGHAFFVPTTSAGRQARVQGTVMLMKDGKECDEMEANDAQLEIDATGVELM